MTGETDEAKEKGHTVSTAQLVDLSCRGVHFYGREQQNFYSYILLLNSRSDEILQAPVLLQWGRLR